MKLQDLITNLDDYKIVNSVRRTISIRNLSLENPYSMERFSIIAPKTIFTFKRNKQHVPSFNEFKCFAINDKDEVCYQPLLNIDDTGFVCFEDEQVWNKYSFKQLLDLFHSTPNSYCADFYSDSLNQYFPDSNLKTFNVPKTVWEANADNRCESVIKFYKDHKNKNFDLVPLHDFSIQRLGSLYQLHSFLMVK